MAVTNSEFDHQAYLQENASRYLADQAAELTEASGSDLDIFFGKMAVYLKVAGLNTTIQKVWSDPDFSPETKKALTVLLVIGELGTVTPGADIGITYENLSDQINKYDGEDKKDFFQELNRLYPDTILLNDAGDLSPPDFLKNPVAYVPPAPKLPENMPGNESLPSRYQGPADQAGKGYYGLSPLVLDLDGDGVEVSQLGYGSAGSHVYFDMDNDGFAERTAWANGGDGLLCIDRNSNGKIDSQSELFGNTATYADGFANLKQYDSNNDNKVTAADTQWGKLRVWVDADSDGFADTGELRTLSSLGITEVRLSTSTPEKSYLNGNFVSDTSTFLMNGSVRTVSDVWFQNDHRDTRFLGEVNLDVRTMFLPTLRGFGEMKDLHIAMSENHELLGLVQKFVAEWNVSKFGSVALGNEIADILFTWAGVKDIPADNSYGGFGTGYEGPYDIRAIRFLEKITGNPIPGDISPSSGEQAYINFDAYSGLFQWFKNQLILQVQGGGLFDSSPAYNFFSGEFSGGTLSHSSISSLVDDAKASGNPTQYWHDVLSALFSVKEPEEYSSSDRSILIGSMQLSGSARSFDQEVDLILNSGGYPYVYNAYRSDWWGGNVYMDVSVVGSNAGDLLQGAYGNDFIRGMGGNDHIIGGMGNDFLEGGRGNDFVGGGEGNDTYIYTLGLDTYRESNGFDVVDVRGNFSASGTTFSRDIFNLHDNLNIYLNGTLSIIVDGFFSNSYTDGNIEKLFFQDGSFIDLRPFSENIYGTQLSEALTGADYYLLKDDVIFAYEGNDILTGGKGSDYLNGAEGDDVYKISAGDGKDIIFDRSGNDSIEMGVGIEKSSLSFAIDFYDLIIYYGTGNTITIHNHYYDELGPYVSPSEKIETLKLSDGSIINLAGVLPFRGTDADDTILGTSRGESINGMRGNDYLSGGTGNDTYIFSVGDGVDTVYEQSGADTILMGAGITASNIRFERSEYNLLIWYGTSDKVILYNQFYDDSYSTSYYDEVETLKFSNGTSINLKGGLTFTGLSSDDYLSGTSMADTLNGRAGNDYLSAGAGNDTYMFSVGDGVDRVYEQSGADTIQMGSGITVSNIRFERSGSDLFVWYGTSDEVILYNQFYDDSYGTSYYDEVETLKFSNGTSINLKGGLTFTGLSSDDYLSGTSMADTLNGRAGNDYLSAGAGNDTYMFSVGDGVDRVYEQSGADTIQMGSGITVSNIRFERSGSDLFVWYGTSDEVILYNQFYDDSYGTSYYDEVETLKFSNGTSINLKGGLTFTGLSSDDYLSGTSMADTLNGGAGNDMLWADGGNDTLNGGAGNDTLNGGLGVDTVSYVDAVSAVSVNLGLAGAQNTIGAGTDSIYNIENLLGSAYNDTLTGDAGANNIDGSAGNDTIQGGAGNDVMQGGAGTDTVSYAAAASGVTVNIGLGAAQNTVGAGTDTLAGFENILGSGYADTLTGSAGANTINGGAGTDTLIGGLGADLLTGGTAADIFKFLPSGLDANSDTITDFSKAQGDRLDLKDLLAGYDPVTKAITDFIEMTTSGTNTVVKVDRDGAGTGYGWQQVAILQNVTGLTDEAALKSSGNLVV